MTDLRGYVQQGVGIPRGAEPREPTPTVTLAEDECLCEHCQPYQACWDCCDDADELDDDLRCRSELLAWNTLRTLTGGRVGNCPVTVRPCLTEPCNACNAKIVGPHLRHGDWYNLWCGGPECSCSEVCEIVLPGRVAELQQVLLDGISIDLSLFRIDNGNRLVRMDGCCFPSCQHMGCELGEPGTLGITYIPGIKPDASGLWAAGVLACEFTKACSGGKCRLPNAVTSIARQGVSMEIAPGMFDGGLTGIREVDAFIMSVNPHGLRTAPKVFSPDLPQHQGRFQSWP